MAQKYLVAMDRARVRIYRFSQQPGQFTPSIQPVDALDFPHSRLSDDENELEIAVRFRGTNLYSSGSEGEGASSRWEVERRVIEQVVQRISAFLEKNPDSTWTLASGSGLRDQVIEALPENVRLRLDRVISKDLLNLPPIELREHFVLR